MQNLYKYYLIQKGFLDRAKGHVKTVDGVGFQVRRGEILGLVGESGCGKNTIGHCLLRAIEPTSGAIRYYMRNSDQEVDLLSISKEELWDFRTFGQMIFQDPFSTLNPHLTILQIVGEPLTVNNMDSGRGFGKPGGRRPVAQRRAVPRVHESVSPRLQWRSTAAHRNCLVLGFEPAIHRL